MDGLNKLDSLLNFLICLQLDFRRFSDNKEDNKMNCKIRKAWLEAESEHSGSHKIQLKIVKQHLEKYGCNYYPELFKMEKKLVK